jgi:polyisoprenoid-binding protein YceI
MAGFLSSVRSRGAYRKEPGCAALWRIQGLLPSSRALVARRGIFRRSSGLFFSCIVLGGWVAPLPAAESTVTIDRAQSQIEIAVKATGDSFVGKLADFTPTVLLDAASAKVTTAKVAFHFADVRTGNEKRDHEMNVWQQTDKFPDGEFTLAGLEAAGAGKFTARGALTFHGVTQSLVFPVSIARDGATLTVGGEVVVDTRAFGLPIIKKFVVAKVDPLVTVRFHLVGNVAAP